MKIFDLEESFETKRQLSIITAETLEKPQRNLYLATRLGLNPDTMRKKLALWVEKGYIVKKTTLGGMTLYKSQLEL